MKPRNRKLISGTLISILIMSVLLTVTPSLVVWANNYQAIIAFEDLDVAKLRAEDPCIVVFGAGLSNGEPSLMLANRLDRAYDLYQAGVATEILLSGDYTPPYYDEVSAMKRYLVDKGIPEAALKLDQVGFSTFATVENLLPVADRKFIFVSQKYHLPRMLEIARRLNIDASAISFCRLAPSAMACNSIW